MSLYKTNLTDRRLVALAQKPFVNTDPTKTFIKTLVQAGKELKLPIIKDFPNFLTKTSNEYK